MVLESIPTGKIFETIAFSFFVSLLIVPFVTRFAFRIGLMDVPNAQPHKIHKRPVPLCGGITFMLTLTLVAVFLNRLLPPLLQKLLLCAFMIFGFSLWDDFKPLPAWVKLLGQLCASVLLYILGVRVQIMLELGPIFGFPVFLNETLNFLITIFWLIFITNAYNLVDSMDGLMIGLACFALTFFMIASMDVNQWSLSVLCAAMLGSCIVLNFFNSSPAFLFLGDSGAQTIGFLLAAIAILYEPPSKLQTNTWFMPILLLGIPIFDTVLVIFSRLRRKQHFYSSGTDHTYHRLISHGFSSVQAVQSMQLAAIALEILAFLRFRAIRSPRT